MAGIEDLIKPSDKAALDSLLQGYFPTQEDPGFVEVMSDIQHDPEGTATKRAKISNADLIDMLKREYQLGITEGGVNPGAWLDPRQATLFSRAHLPQVYVPERKAYVDVSGLYDPQKNVAQVYADPEAAPADLLNTIVHENVHRTTHGRNLRQPEGTTPGLRGEITAAYRKAYPHKSHVDINYGPEEPAAWAAAEEATDPGGGMPIQEDMSRQGLGTLYALMTTPGPVATGWDGREIEDRGLPEHGLHQRIASFLSHLRGH